MCLCGCVNIWTFNLVKAIRGKIKFMGKLNELKRYIATLFVIIKSCKQYK